jgi:DNA segregation ATPase FtsK/SpoIIIE, S-DNA-T family
VTNRFTDRPNTRLLVSSLLFLLAATSLTSLLLEFWASGSQNLMVILLRAPSGFFVESFHLASFYVPAVLCAAGLFVLTDHARPLHLILLGGSLVPFFTLAVAFRIGSDSAVADSRITASLVTAVGAPVSMVATALLAALEVVAMVYLWHSYRNRDAVSLRFMAPVTALLGPPRTSMGPETLVDLPEPDTDDEHPVETAIPVEPVWLADPERPGDPPGLEAPVEFVAEVDDVVVDVDVDDEAYTDDPDDDDPELTAPLELSFSRGRFAPAEQEDDRDDPEFDESRDTDTELDGPAPGPASGTSRKRGRPLRKPRSLQYHVPIEGLLDEYKDDQYWRIDETTRAAAETLRFTLEEFGIQAEVTGIRKGPVITMFEILPAPGVKLSKIVNLADNIALRLAASSVRIVAPIPGKHAVGIEIPNAHRAIVGFAELLQAESFRAPRMEIPIALGKDILGDAQIVDLTRMPHVLIAGATGSGKSVCVNSIICSILYRRSPREVKLILIDPKIVELKFYNDIPHLLTPVVTDPKRAFQALQYCIYEMERRYTLLDSLQVRDVQSYNRKIASKELATEPLPYIVVVVDEFADLMATSGRELESTLARLAAMSRAVGIHLVLATQRPSTDVITGLIKANIPSRIAFMVASKVDGRIILDTQGAEKLLGRGDMLFTSAWDPFPLRLQGAFLSDEEVERVVEYVKQLGEPDYIDDEIFVDEDEDDYVQGELEDPLMEKAIDIVITANKASASYLQRRLKVGYNRAARMVEEMERLGMVGPQQGSKPREIVSLPDRR